MPTFLLIEEDIFLSTLIVVILTFPLSSDPEKRVFAPDRLEAGYNEKAAEFDGNAIPLSHDIFTVVRGDGGYRCNGVEFTVSTMPRPEIKSLKQPQGVLIFDASALKFPFVCRPWRDGDWFVPFGMKGRKKISDFFTDMKYDLFRKSGAVMVVDTSDLNRDESRVAAVLGERIDDRYKVTPATSSVLMIKIGFRCGI